MVERQDPSRRGVIRGSAAVGGGIATAALLAACGSEGTQASNEQGDAAAGGAIALAEVPVGGGAIIAETETVITQPAAGEYFGFSSICTPRDARSPK